MKTIRKLEEIMEVIFETFHLPSMFINSEKNIVLKHQAFERIELEQFDLDLENMLPQIRTMPNYQNYVGIPITKEYETEGMLLLGPSVYAVVTADILKQIDIEISLKETSELVAYYQRFPILAFDQLNHIASLAYYMVYGRRVQMEDIVEYNFYKVQAAVSAQKILYKTLSIGRQHDMQHHSYESEKRIFDCIRRGETKQLLKILNQPLDGEIGVLSKSDPVRSMKNAVIIYTGLASRTMIQAGVSCEVAYSLNDAYVQLVEESLTLENMHSLLTTMLCDCSELVNDISTSSHSKIVKGCLEYIYSHLYEEISVKEISMELHFNQNYISRIFKQEVGKTISEFINQERVEEAKKLLADTKFTIMDIVAFLHFHDQSHFTRVFKDFTGTTPKRYRDQF